MLFIETVMEAEALETIDECYRNKSHANYMHSLALERSLFDHIDLTRNLDEGSGYEDEDEDDEDYCKPQSIWTTDHQLKNKYVSNFKDFLNMEGHSGSYQDSIDDQNGVWIIQKGQGYLSWTVNRNLANKARLLDTHLEENSLEHSTPQEDAWLLCHIDVPGPFKLSSGRDVMSGGARPKVLLLGPEDSHGTSSTGSNMKVDSPVQTSSRLSKTFREIVHDSNALQCVQQYLDSRGVGHLLRFWHDANSFQAATLTRIHSQSTACYVRSVSKVTESGSDSEIGSQDHGSQEQENMQSEASCDSVIKIKATGSDPGPVTSSTSVKSSEIPVCGSCDTGQMPPNLHNSERANPPHNPSTADSFNQMLRNGQSHTNSADVSDIRALSSQGSETSNLAEVSHMATNSVLDLSIYLPSGSPVHSAHRTNSQSESSCVSVEAEPPSDHLVKESNVILMKKLTLYERLLKSIEDDAIKIYSKYISKDATQLIGIPDRLRNETISKICCEDGNVDPRCFAACQEFVMDYIEKQYYKDFSESEYHCMHQIHVLTQSKVNLVDILYNESAIVYFMEFMEREDAMNLLQCWLELDSFQQHLASQQGQYDSQQAQNDAMVIYEKYFSLQASQPLGFEDDMRFEVECNICKQEGPLPDCFTKPKRLLLRTIDKLYFQQYIKSDLYYKYLSDLISTVQTAEDLPPERRKRSGSDASSEKSFGSQSTGSENVGTKNTLLATDTSGFHIKKALKRMNINMRIDKDLLDPDALWHRHNATKLSFGRMDALGQFVSEFDHDPELERKKNVTFFKRRKEKQREDEQLALQIASMIVSDITSITSQDFRSAIQTEEKDPLMASKS